MAAPAFVKAGTGVTIASGSAAATVASTTAGNVIVLQVLQDGTTASAVTLSAHSNVENLAGTDNAITNLALAQTVGSALQHLYIGRSLGGTVSVTVATTGDDLYYRLYEFSGVNTGTTLADVLENGTAGAVVNGSGTSTSIADSGVTTLGADRLAVQFVGCNDDIAVDAFTGATGGTWVEAVAEFASATGTDGCIQLQISGMGDSAAISASGGTGIAFGHDSTSTQVATRFTAPGTGTAQTVKVLMSVTGAPTDDVIVEIRTESGGLPSSTVVGSSATVNVAGTTLTEYSAAVAAPVTAATNYWIVLRRTSSIDASNYYRFADGTGGGTAARYSGATWSLSGTNMSYTVTISGNGAAGTINGGSDTVVSAGWGVIGFALIPPASGTAHTSSPADTLALADARSIGQGQGVTDALALADAFARTTITARAVADPVAVADLATLVKAVPKTVADTLAISDSLAAAKSKTVAVNDTVALADSATSAKTIPKSVADTLVLTDARAIGQGQAVADTLTVADATTRAKTIPKSVADTVALTDSASPVLSAGAVGHTRSITDTVALTDSVTRAEANAVGITDTLALSDTFSRAATYHRTQADAVALADALASAKTLARTITDSVALTDATTRAKAAVKSLADTVALTDSAAPLIVTARTVADAVALADALARVVAKQRALADTVALADVFARVTAASRAVADSVVLTDAVTRAATVARALADTLTLADQVAASIGHAVALADAVAVADDVQAVNQARVDYTVTVDDTVAVSDLADLDRVFGGSHTGYIDFPGIGMISQPIRGGVNTGGRGAIDTAGRGTLATATTGGTG